MPFDGSAPDATRIDQSVPKYVATRDGQVVDLTNPDLASVLTLESANRILRIAAIASVKARQRGEPTPVHDELILSLGGAIRLAGRTAADRKSA